MGFLSTRMDKHSSILTYAVGAVTPDTYKKPKISRRDSFTEIHVLLLSVLKVADPSTVSSAKVDDGERIKKKVNTARK